jgi:hypothetical protein
MMSADGRALAKYIAKCALSPGMTLVKTTDQGSYAYSGAVAVAPGWYTGSCDTTCQEKISACMLALINRDGKHVAVQMVSAAPSLWMIGPTGDDVNYPNQEGAVFGNLFAASPKLFSCTGTESTKAPQVKRFCINDAGCDIFTKVGTCAAACTQTFTTGPGGKKVYSATSCKDPSGKVWSNPITTFVRNRMEGGNYDAGQGIVSASNFSLNFLDNGDWFQMKDVQFGTVDGALKTLEVTTSSITSGNIIEAHLDSLTGPLLGKITTASTGAMNNYLVRSGALNSRGITGRHSVFFAAKGGADIGSVSFVELK